MSLRYRHYDSPKRRVIILSYTLFNIYSSLQCKTSNLHLTQTTLTSSSKKSHVWKSFTFVLGYIQIWNCNLNAFSVLRVDKDIHNEMIFVSS